jgi:dTDP-4-dehydrorhamnose reductase
MNLPSILVTGADGQVGSELRALANSFPRFRFVFTTHADLSIEDPEALENLFSSYKPGFLINAAGYTSVDKAEAEKEKAFSINALAVSVMASLCKKYQTQFIHLSTDYVFDGNADTPYTENSIPNAAGVYGSSKLMGEELALKANTRSLIIRTSWVYSEFGKNFVKTMLRLMKEKKEITVVNDQFGSPTYAADLAETLVYLISNCRKQIENNPGIYHYTNQGIISWYEFAVAIKEISGSPCLILPISTREYPTAAKRPAYSALDTSRIRKIFGISLNEWKTSLAKCMHHIKNTP